MDQASRGDKKTVITSVSVAKEMQEIIDQYNLSPSEIYRRGIAVMLCDMGISKYDTPMNRERNDYVKDFFKDQNWEEIGEKIKVASEVMNALMDGLKGVEKNENKK